MRRRSALRRGLLCAAWLLGCSCSLLHFPDTAGIVTRPGQDNQVLEQGELPQVSFPFPVDHGSVEAIFRVEGFEGGVAGSYLWQGNTVSFRAAPELVRGSRYVLRLQGVFRDEEGVECSVDRLVPFYWASAPRAPPYVEWTAPASGQVIGPTAEVAIRFSQDMDPLALAGALHVSPDCAVQERWEEGTRRLLLKAVPSWRDLTVYTLRIDGGLRDLEGRPLCRELQIVFLVQEDVEPPTVLSIRPALNDPGLLYPETGAELETGVAGGDALRITFSEPMNRTATAGAFTLCPALSGSLVWLEDRTLVFCPLSSYAAGATYLLSFGPAAADASGNPVAGPREASFTPTAQTISVSTELVYDAVRIAPGAYTTAVAREVRVSAVSGEYELVFEFTGARFQTDSEKAAVHECIRLDCLFPPTGAADPWPLGYSWTGDERLSVTFAGLQASTATQSYYYLLSLRGGETGIRGHEGSRLERDLEQLLITVERGP